MGSGMPFILLQFLLVPTRAGRLAARFWTRTLWVPQILILGCFNGIKATPVPVMRRRGILLSFLLVLFADELLTSSPSRLIINPL
jgi:hypothetical protein